MPGRDQTGPMGMGRMTGRGRGYCAGFEAPGFRFGYRGRAFAGGRGRRYNFFTTGLPGWLRVRDSESEAQALRNQVRNLREQLDMLEKRLAATETGAASEGDK